MTCKECGEEFTTKARGRKNRGFCCHYCADKYRKRQQQPKHTKICEYCREVYNTNNSKQRYCSIACRGTASSGRTVYRKVCKYCEEQFESLNSKQQFCTAACGSRYNADKMRKDKMQICEYCGESYYSDHPERSRYCSKECWLALQRKKAEIRRKQIEEDLIRRNTTECSICGKIFIADVKGKKYCSSKCKDIYKQHYKPSFYLCKECGESVITEYGDKRRIYCSEECMNRYLNRLYKSKRKQIIREAYVEPVNLIQVYRRDCGLCQICGLPVPFDNNSLNDWGATVDHVIPLTKNGLHSMNNSQLAHRICNSLKSNTVDTFSIDWEEMVRQDEERWSFRLEDLFLQLDKEQRFIDLRVGHKISLQPQGLQPLPPFA